MPQPNLLPKKPLLLLGLSLAATLLAVVVIGFPGICGYTGRYGDTLERYLGFWAVLILFFLPPASVLGSVIWGIAAFVRRWDRSSIEQTPENL